MQMTILFVAGAVVGAVVTWLAGRGRLAEMAGAVRDARERENAAKEMAASSSADLRMALEEKGRFQAEAARVEEIKLAHESAMKELKSQITSLSESVDTKQRALTEAEVKNATLSSTIAEREASLKNEREQFAETKAALRGEFAELSAIALKDNGATFLEVAKREFEIQHQAAEGDLEQRQKEIAKLVGPIQEGIKAVSQAARDMETTRATAFGTIEEQLRQSVVSATEVAKQAGALKDALKKPNVRGRWGEVQLQNCVELAGMEEHCDVEFQETSLSAEDEAMRPDMIVRMPGGRKIAVDSKTPMVHFLSYIDASTDDERQAALTNHARSVRKHVSDLAKTDYMQRMAESPDFVVMFLPNESFLAMALEKEPTLMEEALKRKVLVATPGTLIGLLKVVQFGWNEQKIAQNAQRIADEGCKLNGEIVTFLADFAKLSLALDAVNEAFGNSRRRVENQIAKSSLNLTDLGAKNRLSVIKGKKVAGEVANILKAAGADDEEIQQTEVQELLALSAVSGDDEGEE
jgi:DNA recombination protein RmuC